MTQKNTVYAGAHSVNKVHITGHEIKLNPEETIVSKTDEAGAILYVNDVFVNISGFSEDELLGAPHSIVRHPHMPRSIFKLMWDTIKSGKEIFAYVVNRCKNGDHYWIFAHVTPCYDLQGKLIGFHSARRAPTSAAVAAIEPFYRQLVEIENKRDRKEGLAESEATLQAMLEQKKISYGEFIFSL